eukprot:CAMPEP_0194760244 /NCGR_PEP_ID=MMETSP0323_2-20130528/13187_1 /TAXON_ID=2866 ORGANISM="Crypthecodinium cohnii, Strain Seligo" /NCGR_SAMPLE_ID=MMETSP0323_2 /ASSEMBLY_ACC=CAM_ASM_000346 /LENGTH=103 /DNA_ID=CAMNT_0039681413 /DNA_START=303 /DNA_END=609 /DNA_ORIENTATION=-
MSASTTGGPDLLVDVVGGGGGPAALPAAELLEELRQVVLSSSWSYWRGSWQQVPEGRLATEKIDDEPDRSEGHISPKLADEEGFPPHGALGKDPKRNTSCIKV